MSWSNGHTVAADSLWAKVYQRGWIEMADKKLRFQAKIAGQEAGVVAAITPPVDVIEWLATRARVPIRGTINGFPFRSSLMPCGSGRMMPVNKMLCRGAGVQPGDLGDDGARRGRAHGGGSSGTQIRS